MPSWVSRLRGGSAAPVETKSDGPQAFITLTALRDASWSGRGFASLATEGFAKNPIVYRCVRLVAESAARVPFAVRENGKPLTDHPLLTLLTRPNAQMAGAELFECL